ncbi:MAG TPA: glycosyltransferase family 4 protein [Micromonospora sp.]|nr:glycosyltransferase family 4 protein [Micromonospora sp.]
MGELRALALSDVHVVLPNDIDDPTAPSGGNVYDRRICRGLATQGWSVREHAIHGAWPRPGRSEQIKLAHVLASLPDNAVVLLDGLVAAPAPEVLTAQARRLRLVVLVHMLLGDETVQMRHREGVALNAASAIITTSFWTRRRLGELYALPAERVHVAVPGVDTAPLSPGSDAGTELLCVATVTPQKGHDLLIAALARVADRPWNCVCVGALDRDPGFVDRLRQRTLAYGLAGRLHFPGPRTGPDLDARYACADVLVLASRGETYGMVVTEALARGIPVLATAADGLPETLGRAPDGSRPGLLVEPDDPSALAGALDRWLNDADLRQQLRRSARDRRITLTGWAVTSELVSDILQHALVPAVRSCGQSRIGRVARTPTDRLATEITVESLRTGCG